MHKKIKDLVLAGVILLSVSPYLSIGQINVTSDQQANPTTRKPISRFYNVTTFIPVTVDGQFLSGVQTICGYRLNSKLFIGGGIGFEHYISLPTYEDFKADPSLLPVFADIRYTFLSGRVSPVLALNGGYKFLLNRPSTQHRFDTVYSSIITVSARDDLEEYTIYKRGGPFITAEAGVSFKIIHNFAIYLSADYTLSSISGDYHLSDKEDLLGADNKWRLKTSSESVDNSLAYIHEFFLRLGIVF